MQKWTVIVFVIGLAAIAGAMVLSGIGWDMLKGLKAPESPVEQQKTQVELRDHLFSSCIGRLEERGLVDATKNRPQAEWACTCFADQIHEKFGNMKLADFESEMLQDDAHQLADALFTRCSYAAGLN